MSKPRGQGCLVDRGLPKDLAPVLGEFGSNLLQFGDNFIHMGSVRTTAGCLGTEGAEGVRLSRSEPLETRVDAFL